MLIDNMLSSVSQDLEIKKIVEEKEVLKSVVAAQEDGDGLLKVTNNVLSLKAELELARSEVFPLPFSSLIVCSLQPYGDY